MPNHVKNILAIIGVEDAVAKCVAAIKGEGEDKFIDFTKINPLPKELEGTRSPMKIVSEEEYNEQEARIAADNITDIERYAGLSRCLTAELAKQYQDKFGADNWYDWQCNNWGTKWNAYDQMEGTDSDGNHEITFYTAWSTPEPILQTLSEKYPDLKFSIRYADEDFGSNVGEYTLQDGDEIEVNIPKGGTLTAYRMAMDIREEEENQLVDYLCNYAEELDNYTENMVLLAHEHQYLEDGYPQFVLERLKELAERDGQTERAAEIAKRIKIKPPQWMLKDKK